MSISEKNIKKSFENVKKDILKLGIEINGLEYELNTNVKELKQSIYKHSELMEKVLYNQNALLQRIKKIEKKLKSKK
ncbi:MAG: hypothetical protein QXE31_05380 [Candidatus Woesearchaeota archaeon]